MVQDLEIGDIVSSHDRYFKLEKVLGNGVCGPVYLAIERSQPHKRFALKTISHATKQSEEWFLNYLQKAHIPGIVNLEFIIYNNSGSPCMLGLEYCEGGDLFTAISSLDSDFFYQDSQLELPRPQLELKLTRHNEKVRTIFLNILRTVNQSHRLGVYHRDLKPENILLTSQGQVRIGDFGLATRDKLSREFGCGSVYYIPPEVHYYHPLQPSYSPAQADIWSLGILFINLVAGQNPWEIAHHTSYNFAQYVLNPTMLLELFPLTPTAFVIACSLLQIDPHQRPPLEDIIAMVTNCHDYIEPLSPSNSPTNSTTNSSPLLDPIDSYLDPIDPYLIPTEKLNLPSSL